MMPETQINGVPNGRDLVGSRVIVQGASGAGKTYALRKILESTYGQMQHIVLDVEDELFTLREKFDYLLIGGDAGDAPLHEDTADRLATVLLETGMSAILQLNDFGLAGQRRIIGKFLSGLMKAPKALWHPVLITLDEAHRYCPQSGVVESSEAITNLATAGRKRGFGAIFATQRLSLISKDVLGQCPNRVIGRVDQGLDRRAASDLLGFAASSDEGRGLMTLKHQFWVVGPAFAPEPRLVTFGPTATTHLASGHGDVPVPPPASRVQAMIGQIIAISPEDRNTPKSEVSGGSLEGEVKLRLQKAIAAEKQRWIDEGVRRGMEEGLFVGLERAKQAIDSLDPGRPATSSPMAASKVTPPHVKPVKDEPIPAPADAGQNKPLTGPETTLLKSLAWWRSMGKSKPSRAMAAAIAGWRVTSGHLKNVAGSLRSKGLIEYPAEGLIALTPAGIQHAPPPEMRLDVFEALRETLNGPQRVVVDTLRHGGRMTRESLCRSIGWEPTSGHVKNVLGSLRTLEVVEYPNAGEVELVHWLAAAHRENAKAKTLESA